MLINNNVVGQFTPVNYSVSQKIIIIALTLIVSAAASTCIAAFSGLPFHFHAKWISLTALTLVPAIYCLMQKKITKETGNGGVPLSEIEKLDTRFLCYVNQFLPIEDVGNLIVCSKELNTPRFKLFAACIGYIPRTSEEGEVYIRACLSEHSWAHILPDQLKVYIEIRVPIPGVKGEALKVAAKISQRFNAFKTEKQFSHSKSLMNLRNVKGNDLDIFLKKLAENPNFQFQASTIRNLLNFAKSRTEELNLIFTKLSSNQFSEEVVTSLMNLLRLYDLKLINSKGQTLLHLFILSKNSSGCLGFVRAAVKESHKDKDVLSEILDMKDDRGNNHYWVAARSEFDKQFYEIVKQALGRDFDRLRSVEVSGLSGHVALERLDQALPQIEQDIVRLTQDNAQLKQHIAQLEQHGVQTELSIDETRQSIAETRQINAETLHSIAKTQQINAETHQMIAQVEQGIERQRLHGEKQDRDLAELQESIAALMKAYLPNSAAP